MAKSDANGRLQIRNLPVGEHQLQFWHERTGYLKNLPIGNLKTDDRGRLVISITDGSREDLEMKVPAKVLE